MGRLQLRIVFFYLFAPLLLFTAGCSNAIPGVEVMSESAIIPSPSNSVVVADVASLTADGSTVNVTVKLYDSAMGPLVGRMVQLSSSRSSQDSISSLVPTDSAGVANFTVTSLVAGSATLSAYDITDSMAVTQTAVVSFTPGVPTAADSTLAVNDSTLTADGLDTASITVILKDAYGNIVPNKSIKIVSTRVASDSFSTNTIISDTDGKAVFALNSLVAGSSTISAEVAAHSMTVAQTAAMTFEAGAPTATDSTVVESVATVVADGSSTSTITVTLKDAYLNLVSGKTVTLSSNRGDNISPSSATTDASGVATFAVSATLAGSSTYTATVGAVTVTDTPSVSFVPGVPTAAQSTVVTDFSERLNDGVSLSTITITLRDAYNNLVSGKNVTLASDRGSMDVISAASGASTALGVVTFTVKSAFAGTGKFTATDTTDTLTLSFAKVRFYSPLAISPASVSVTVSTPVAFSYTGGVGPYSFSQMSGGGSISPDGVYTAGLSAGPAVVRVTDTGTGSTSDATIAVSLGGAYLKVAMGNRHACGIMTNNKLKCWGAGQAGQIGNGANLSMNSPVAIDTITSYKTITAGNNYTCGLTTSDKLKCWGTNASGQLGIGNLTAQNVPAEVTPAVSYQFLTSGLSHSCAITTSTNKLFCWGLNGSYQLGNGVQTNSNVPIAVDSTQDYNYASAGQDYSCAIRTSGDLYCWGGNGSGQVGTGTNATQTSLFLVGAGYSQVAAGTSATCAIKTNSIYCWGNNTAGQFGNGGYGFLLTPTKVSGSEVYQSVTMGPNYGCGIKSSGALFCWGINYEGQVGTNNTIMQNTAVQIDSGNAYAFVNAGFDSTCGIIASSGALRCWGVNIVGQLGYYSSQRTPVQVAIGTSFGSISKASKRHTCAVGSDNVLKCWGSNSSGQLGDGTYTDRDAPTAIGSDYAMVSASGYSHVCAITTLGRLRCWGYVATYGVGNGINQSYNTPQDIDSGETYKTVATGSQFSCGITTSNILKCWGANANGQLGIGNTSPSLTPIDADAGTTYSSISLHGDVSCGITASSQLRCWGYGFFNQLANGGTQSSSPVVVDNGVSYSKVSVGSSHVCAVTSTGTLKCWGQGSTGQLGTGGSSASAPTVVDSSNLYRTVSSGTYHTCGILATGIAKCWGDNSHGQLGDGTFANRPTPIVVVGNTDNLDVQTGELTTTFLSATGELRRAGHGAWLGLGTFFTFAPGSEVP